MTRMPSVICACLLASSMWMAGARSAQAAGVQRPLSGKAQFGMNGRADIGMPIRPGGKASCVPNGGIDGIKAVAGAKITTTGGVGGSIMVPASQFTLRGAGNPQAAQVRGERTVSPYLLQVATNFAVQVPKPGWAIKPGSGKVPPGGAGRTGPDVVSWCPGSTATVTMGLNPGCANPAVGGAAKVHSCNTSPGPCPGAGFITTIVPGFMKYTRTGKMLGGPGSSAAQGNFGIARPYAGGAYFLKGKAPASLAQGMEFGWYVQQNAGKGPHVLTEMHNACGVITKVGKQDISKFQSNRTIASFGGPFTQGMLTIKVATGTGIESYMLTGYDKRTAKGAGKLQLVAGSVAVRSRTGATAGGAVVTLDVPEPEALASAAAALLVLAVCHRVLAKRTR